MSIFGSTAVARELPRTRLQQPCESWVLAIIENRDALKNRWRRQFLITAGNVKPNPGPPRRRQLMTVTKILFVSIYTGCDVDSAVFFQRAFHELPASHSGFLLVLTELLSSANSHFDVVWQLHRYG